jgi:hypothetical protein
MKIPACPRQSFENKFVTAAIDTNTTYFLCHNQVCKHAHCPWRDCMMMIMMILCVDANKHIF